MKKLQYSYWNNRNNIRKWEKNWKPGEIHWSNFRKHTAVRNVPSVVVGTVILMKVIMNCPSILGFIKNMLSMASSSYDPCKMPLTPQHCSQEGKIRIGWHWPDFSASFLPRPPVTSPSVGALPGGPYPTGFFPHFVTRRLQTGYSE